MEIIGYNWPFFRYMFLFDYISGLSYLDFDNLDYIEFHLTIIGMNDARTLSSSNREGILF